MWSRSEIARSLVRTLDVGETGMGMLDDASRSGTALSLTLRWGRGGGDCHGGVDMNACAVG